MKTGISAVGKTVVCSLFHKTFDDAGGGCCSPHCERKTMKQAGYDLCSLAACAVNGLIPDREKVAAMDLEKLYTVSRMHSLTALCAVALMSAGVELPARLLRWECAFAKY